jgi:hypothetical protein
MQGRPRRVHQGNDTGPNRPPDVDAFESREVEWGEGVTQPIGVSIRPGYLELLHPDMLLSPSAFSNSPHGTPQVKVGIMEGKSIKSRCALAE